MFRNFQLLNHPNAVVLISFQVESSHRNVQHLVMHARPNHLWALRWFLPKGLAQPITVIGIYRTTRRPARRKKEGEQNRSGATAFGIEHLTHLSAVLNGINEIRTKTCLTCNHITHLGNFIARFQFPTTAKSLRFRMVKVDG